MGQVKATPIKINNNIVVYVIQISVLLSLWCVCNNNISSFKTRHLLLTRHQFGSLCQSFIHTRCCHLMIISLSWLAALCHRSGIWNKCTFGNYSLTGTATSRKTGKNLVGEISCTVSWSRLLAPALVRNSENVLHVSVCVCLCMCVCMCVRACVRAWVR